MSEVKVSRVQQVTFLSVPATVTKYNKDLTRNGSLTEWLADAVGQPVEHPAGTVVAHLLHGKGYKTRVLDTFVTADRASADAWLRQRLAD